MSKNGHFSFDEALKLQKAIRPALRSVELLQLGAFGTSYVQSPFLRLETNKGRLGELFLKNLLQAKKDRKTGHDLNLPLEGKKAESKVRVLAQEAAGSAYIATINEGDVARCTADYLMILAYVPPTDKLELLVYRQEELKNRRAITVRYSTADNEFTEKGGAPNVVPLPEDLTCIASDPVKEVLADLSPAQLLDLIRNLGLD